MPFRIPGECLFGVETDCNADYKEEVVGEGKCAVVALEYLLLKEGDLEERWVCLAEGHMVKFLELESQSVKMYSELKVPVSCLAAREDGKLVVVGSTGGDVVVLRTDTQLPLRQYGTAGHVAKVTSACFLASRTKLVTLCELGRLCVWDLSESTKPILVHDDLKLPEAAQATVVAADLYAEHSGDAFFVGSSGGGVHRVVLTSENSLEVDERFPVCRTEGAVKCLRVRHGDLVAAVGNRLLRFPLAPAGPGASGSLDASSGAEPAEALAPESYAVHLSAINDLKLCGDAVVTASADGCVKCVLLKGQGEWKLLHRFDFGEAVLSCVSDKAGRLIGGGTQTTGRYTFYRISFDVDREPASRPFKLWRCRCGTAKNPLNGTCAACQIQSLHSPKTLWRGRLGKLMRSHAYQKLLLFAVAFEEPPELPFLLEDDADVSPELQKLLRDRSISHPSRKEGYSFETWKQEIAILEALQECYCTRKACAGLSEEDFAQVLNGLVWRLKRAEWQWSQEILLNALLDAVASNHSWASRSTDPKVLQALHDSQSVLQSVTENLQSLARLAAV